MDRTTHAGSCHCGALALEFHSAKPLAPRACDCSFCRKHGARSVSDPDGHATIRIATGHALLRYRFGLKTADFLICGRCGVYVAAVIDIEGQSYSVLNLNTFEDSHSDLPGQPMSYQGESAEDRAERRRRVWTPSQILSR